ncbi:MAG: Mur ligase family protein [Patescibacteria group bacterium]|jgi:UDP-N-acetylmuramoylalanine--D-glutamate ligase
MDLNDLKNKTIHVVGLSGTEGSSLALFLILLGGKNLIGHEIKSAKDFKKNFFSYQDNLSKKQKEKTFQLIVKSFSKINFDKKYLQGLSKNDIIFAPSSWFRYPVNGKLKKYRLWNWYNLLLEFFPGKVVGVTGTAGKGTVTNLVYQMLVASKKKAFLVGESWHFVDFYKIIKSGSDAIVVAEVNNRTLTFARYVKKSPAIALITNIFPHHLDDHGHSFANYKKVKLNLCKYQSEHDTLIINADDLVLKKITWPNRTIFYGEKKNSLPKITNPYFSSTHLKSDALAAMQLAKILKIKANVVKKTLNNFAPRSGRMEFVRSVKGVRYINDSAATRPKATLLAVKSLPLNKGILILEGSRINPDELKGEYQALINTIKTMKVRLVLTSGLITPYLSKLFKLHGLELVAVENLQTSVKRAFKSTNAGDVVLLSPANESFGEFKDYRERGAKFIKLVNKLSL